MRPSLPTETGGTFPVSVPDLATRLLSLPLEIRDAELDLLKARADVNASQERLKAARGIAMLNGDVVNGKNAEQREAQVYAATGAERADLTQWQEVESRKAAVLSAKRHELDALKSVAALIASCGGVR